MTLIKSITLRNFQKHKKLKLQFDPKITVIVGPNDAGKSSAAFRAVKWAALNQPTGDWMIRHGKTSCKAVLEFDDCAVERRKGKANLYLLDGKPHRAFGAGKVPDTVAAVVRMDEINFQGQDDLKFWLSDSPGKVSRELNRIVDLGVIDSTLAAATSHLKKATAVREVCQDRVKEAREAKAKLRRVPLMVQEMDAIALLYKETVALAERMEIAEALAGELDAVSRGAAGARRRFEDAGGAKAAWEAFEASRAILSEAEELARSLRSNEKVARKGTHDVPDLWQELALRRAEIDQINKAEEAAKTLRKAEDQLCRATDTAREALSDLKEESAGLCPLCQQRTPTRLLS